MTYLKVLRMFFCTALMLIMSQSPVLSSSLDFSWGTPVYVRQKTNPAGRYLAWPIHLSNNTSRWISPRLEIVAVTDTGRQYNPNTLVKIKTRRPYDQALNLDDIQSNIFPSVTRPTVVIFENVDPNAHLIHFYVGGLTTVSKIESSSVKYLHVTYTKSGASWKWDGKINVLE